MPLEPAILPPRDPSACSYYTGFYDALILVQYSLQAAVRKGLLGTGLEYHKAFTDTLNELRVPFDTQYRTRFNPPDRAP